MTKSKTKLPDQIARAFLRSVLSDATPGEIKHLPATVGGVDGYTVSVFFPGDCSFSSMALHNHLVKESEYFPKKSQTKNKHERRKTR